MGDLDVANKASLRSIIRVEVSAREPKSRIPRISRRANLPQRPNQRLRRSSRILSSLVRTTDIGKLVMNAVGNNNRVKSLLLSLVAKRVLGLERGFRGGTAVEPGFEFHGWYAKPEV